MRATAAILSACLALQGCSVVDVSERETGGEKSSLALVAVKGDHLRRGYGFKVTRDGREVARGVSQTQPLVISDLEPGEYRVRIKGERISREDVDVVLRAGRETTVKLDVGAARRVARTNGALQDIGMGALYVVGAVVYVTVYVGVLLLEAWADDDCKTCGKDPCTCSKRASVPD
ncbi:MAG: hypothetical protein HYY16_11360 [Planctomycetes bacterium]|nr:hypothetical protein [Planctomycetota bacterium]